MNTIGIISEYNPFHNGHKYHIQAAREKYKAESIVCIMSGSFVQRGEPALFDKWSRAEMALLNGADLVIELPFVYSCQPAEIFAFGAVNTLNNLGIIDGICFGSELGDSEALSNIAAFLLNEPEAFSLLVKKYLKNGSTYPKSVSLALKEYHKIDEKVNTDIWENPNNILGIEYIKSIMSMNSPMVPYTIKRVSSHYNETEITNPMASATAVRQELKKFGMSEKLQSAVPTASMEIIKTNTESGRGPVFMDAYSDILLYKLRAMTAEQIEEYISISEGLEYRIKKAAHNAGCINELIDAIKTKRYTRAFIQRLLCHIMIDLKWEYSRAIKQPGTPSYCRVLGFNDKGKYLLKNIAQASPFPIINKVADFKTDNTELRSIFEFDMKSSDIYCLGYQSSKYKKAGADYYTSPVYV